MFFRIYQCTLMFTFNPWSCKQSQMTWRTTMFTQGEPYSLQRTGVYKCGSTFKGSSHYLNYKATSSTGCFYTSVFQTTEWWTPAMTKMHERARFRNTGLWQWVQSTITVPKYYDLPLLIFLLFFLFSVWENNYHKITITITMQ